MTQIERCRSGALMLVIGADAIIDLDALRRVSSWHLLSSWLGKKMEIAFARVSASFRGAISTAGGADSC